MLEVPAEGFKLNIGAGNKRPPGFLSVDADKASNPDIVATISKVPLPDGCANEIMAIHVIEHVFPWEAPDTLREWFRLLRPKGFLGIECPDFLKCCQNVVNRQPHQHGKQGIWGDASLRNPFHMHKWGWEPKELMALVQEAGFVKVRHTEPKFHGRRSYRDMRIEAIKP